MERDDDSSAHKDAFWLEAALALHIALVGEMRQLNVSNSAGAVAGCAATGRLFVVQILDVHVPTERVLRVERHLNGCWTALDLRIAGDSVVDWDAVDGGGQAGGDNQLDHDDVDWSY